MKLLIATATAALVSTAAFAAPTIGQDARPNAGAFEVNDMEMGMANSNPASVEASTNDNNSRATAGSDVMAEDTMTSVSTRNGIAKPGDAYPIYSR